MTRNSKGSKQVPFFDLRTPADLFEKMRADLERLEKTQDARDAFNFFVTAEHLPDWLERRDVVSESGLLKVVRDIASGAKHFKTVDTRHKYVASAEQQVAVVLGDKPEFVDVYVRLRLQLDEAGKQAIGVETINADELGREVLKFWEPYLMRGKE